MGLFHTDKWIERSCDEQRRAEKKHCETENYFHLNHYTESSVHVCDDGEQKINKLSTYQNVKLASELAPKHEESIPGMRACNVNCNASDREREGENTQKKTCEKSMNVLIWNVLNIFNMKYALLSKC